MRTRLYTELKSNHSSFGFRHSSFPSLLSCEFRHLLRQERHAFRFHSPNLALLVAVPRKAKDHEMRIVKMESWPNQEDRLKALEAQCEHLEREMNALRSSPFTGATLKQVQ